MWGDPERAIRLDPADALATILFQVTGPAHIPWQDQRWQELLHGYNVWVHVECHNHSTDGVVDRACHNVAQHAPRSSNLAAFVMHVTRMLRALIPPELAAAATSSNQNNNTAEEDESAKVAAFSNRIALVGKARATAGSLNLLRILVHAVIAHTPNPQHYNTQDEYLQECFRYKSRDAPKQEQDVAADLLEALLYFMQQCHGLSSSSSGFATTTSSGSSDSLLPPEVYDTLTLVLQLLIVLLSTQLYRPMHSSFQRLHDERHNGHNNNNHHLANHTTTQSSTSSTTGHGYFWDVLLQHAVRLDQLVKKDKTMKPSWTPAGIMLSLMEWQMIRPAAPERSIQQHNSELAAQVVAAKGEKKGSDGMYENHLVVTALSSSSATTAAADGSLHGRTLATHHHHHHHHHRLHTASALLDATKGVLVLSSSIILLPFRLMSLAIGLWQHHGEGSYDQLHKNQLQSSLKHKHASRTKDVLWLSDSPVADLSSCLLLLLINNERAAQNNNPFRTEVSGLTDKRWEEAAAGTSTSNSLLGGEENGLPDLPIAEQEEIVPLVSITPPPPPVSSGSHENALSINFERIFTAFGSTAHTEVGALLLYSIIQASPTFAEAIAVRSDLDTIVLPQLRTLYFASSLRFYAAHDYSSRAASGSAANKQQAGGTSSDAATAGQRTLSIRNCPFRSQSQLYVLIILLLLFSQDASFGSDAFRRVIVPHVPWYKERNLKSISLGSIIILSLLRSLTFNLNRLRDPFLLSNCCAVLMNLSPAIVELHDYAAMRLVGITVTCMKRYLELVRENPDDDEEDLTTPTAMHGEVTRTLLQVIKHALSHKTVDRNLHLLYALVYHQADFRKVVAAKDCPFRKSEISRIQKVLVTASGIIDNAGDARTAAKALKVLSEHVDEIRQVAEQQRSKRKAAEDDFTFTYEEEADPEIFFVPYVWETIVCVATSSSVEWNKNKIRVFPLLEEEEEEDLSGAVEPEPADPTKFSADVADVV